MMPDSGFARVRLCGGASAVVGATKVRARGLTRPARGRAAISTWTVPRDPGRRLGRDNAEIICLGWVERRRGVRRNYECFAGFGVRRTEVWIEDRSAAVRHESSGSGFLPRESQQLHIRSGHGWFEANRNLRCAGRGDYAKPLLPSRDHDGVIRGRRGHCPGHIRRLPAGMLKGLLRHCGLGPSRPSPSDRRSWNRRASARNPILDLEPPPIARSSRLGSTRRRQARADRR